MSEEQLRKNFGDAQRHLRECELAFESAGDAVRDARACADEARFALRNFRAAQEQTKSRAISDAASGVGR